MVPQVNLFDILGSLGPIRKDGGVGQARPSRQARMSRKKWLSPWVLVAALSALGVLAAGQGTPTSSIAVPAGAAPTRDVFVVVKAGDLAALKTLLQRPETVRLRDGEGMTALHYAAFRGDLGAMDALLGAGADPAARDSIGMTPLHAAAFNGHREAVERLLARKAPVDPQDKFGRTPLHYAASNGDVAIIRLLLVKEADGRIKDHKGHTAEDLAKASGWTQAAQVLHAAASPAAPAEAHIAQASRRYTEDDLARLSTTGCTAPPTPDSCCPKQTEDYALNNYRNNVQQMEESLSRMESKKRDLEANLPTLEDRCTAARAEASSGGINTDGSFSRSDEYRRYATAEQACSEYQSVKSQVDYLDQSINSTRRSIQSYRIQAPSR